MSSEQTVKELFDNLNKSAQTKTNAVFTKLHNFGQIKHIPKTELIKATRALCKIIANAGDQKRKAEQINTIIKDNLSKAETFSELIPEIEIHFMPHTVIPHSSQTKRKEKEQQPSEGVSTELEDIEKEFAKHYETGSTTTIQEESDMDIDEYPEQHKEHLENNMEVSMTSKHPQ